MKSEYCHNTSLSWYLYLKRRGKPGINGKNAGKRHPSGCVQKVCVTANEERQREAIEERVDDQVQARNQRIEHIDFDESQQEGEEQLREEKRRWDELEEEERRWDELEDEERRHCQANKGLTDFESQQEGEEQLREEKRRWDELEDEERRHCQANKGLDGQVARANNYNDKAEADNVAKTHVYTEDDVQEYQKRSYQELSSEFQRKYPRVIQLIPLMYNRLTVM
jgi:hypothetical protein